MTQEELAHKAGVTTGTLSLIERGQANPTWSTVRWISEALDLSIADVARQSVKHETSPRRDRSA